MVTSSHGTSHPCSRGGQPSMTYTGPELGQSEPRFGVHLPHIRDGLDVGRSPYSRVRRALSLRVDDPMQWVIRRADLLVADARPTRGCVPEMVSTSAASPIQGCTVIPCNGSDAEPISSSRTPALREGAFLRTSWRRPRRVYPRAVTSSSRAPAPRRGAFPYPWVRGGPRRAPHP